MNASDHYREAEQRLATAERYELTDGRRAALIAEALVHAELAKAAALGADFDPERDLYRDAVRAPVLRIPTRTDKTAAGAATPTTAETTPNT